MKLTIVIVSVLAALTCALLVRPAMSQPAAPKEPAATAPASKPTSRVGGPYGWRGDGSGCFADTKPPTVWDSDKKKGIVWSVNAGSSPYGSPIVTGGKVLVLGDPDLLMCFNAVDGTKLWEKTTTYADLNPKPEEKPQTVGGAGPVTPTPVTDGQFVYVVFGAGIVTCFDLDGNRQWAIHIEGKANAEGGRPSSPALAGGILIVNIGNLRGLDPKTGRIVWNNDKVNEGYGSPIPARVGDMDVVACPGGQVVRASDGAMVANTTTELTYASPVVVDGVAYFINKSSLAAALSPNAKDALGVKTLWEEDVETEDVFASPVIHDGLIYMSGNEGNLQVLDARTGKQVYAKVLGIGGNIYPSLTLAGGNLYVSNDQGDTVVVAPGREYKEVARNKLNHGSGGNMAFAGKRIYVRAGEQMVCLGE